ncbi:MAG: hypothetical protein WCO55_02625 [Candidatus Falkowbacteria bacterium]
MNQETAFKIVFFFAVIVFCITIVGFFLLAVKIFLLFTPELRIMGLIIKSAALNVGSFK